MSFFGLVSVPVLAALSISARRNSCWWRIRAKSPSGNCLRCRIQSSASAPFMWLVPLVNFRYGLWIEVMVRSTFRSTPPSASVTSLKPPKSIAIT